jgi:hypothetical protein
VRPLAGARGVQPSVRRSSTTLALLVGVLAIGCGKSGPPLPPLVHVPVAPANLTADRRGDVVDLEFTIPDMNTDRTRPANIATVDVYAVTGPPTLTDEQLLRRGTKVASVAVKSPKDPNQTVEEDEPTEDVEPAVGAGLDQGAVAHVDETLTAAASRAIELTKEERQKTDTDAALGRPLLGPPPTVPSRIYAAVGVSTRGRKGPLSKRVTAPLIDAPPVPAPPKITYTEDDVTITWPSASVASPSSDGLLPSTPIGLSVPTFGYNVYDVSTDAASDESATTPNVPAASGVTRTPQKLTKTPVTDAKYVDPRIAWGEKRCYSVRAATTIAGTTIESDASPAKCKTFVDTFPPAAPKSLKSVPAERSISLIWDANGEKDLAGYLVFRSTAGGPLQPITNGPIQETTFTDTVQPGVRFVYAIKAVDKAGNASDYSERVEETAR